MGWWDKYQDQPSGLHVEGRDEKGKVYKKKEGSHERRRSRNLGRNMVAIKKQTYNQT